MVTLGKSLPNSEFIFISVEEVPHLGRKGGSVGKHGVELITEWVLRKWVSLFF